MAKKEVKELATVIYYLNTEIIYCWINRCWICCLYSNFWSINSDLKIKQKNTKNINDL